MPPEMGSHPCVYPRCDRVKQTFGMQAIIKSLREGIAIDEPIDTLWFPALNQGDTGVNLFHSLCLTITLLSAAS